MDSSWVVLEPTGLFQSSQLLVIAASQPQGSCLGAALSVPQSANQCYGLVVIPSGTGITQGQSEVFAF